MKRLIDDPGLAPMLEEARKHTMTPERVARSITAFKAAKALPAPWPWAKLIVGGVLVTGTAWALSALHIARPEATVPAPVVLAAPPAAQRDVTPRDTKQRDALPRAPASPDESPRSVPSRSRLAPQLALLAQAQRQADAGEHEAALATLEQLERTYPDTPLVPEIAMARLPSLFATQPPDRVAAHVEELIGKAELAGRRAALLRLYAMLLVRLGRCDEAKAALQRAVGLGLDAAEAQTARTALTSCKTLD